MRNSARFSFGVAVLGWTVFGSTLWSQTDQEVNAGLQFNFSTPGARSLGLGGAFLGIADDATTAYTNPAGLVNLSQQSVALELRAFDFEHQFIEAGHGFGPPTGIGVDTVSGLGVGESSDTTESISFVSFVQPIGDWRLAVYRHELGNFEGGFRTQGPYFEAEGETFRLAPAVVESDLEIVSYGLSLAVPLAKRDSGSTLVALGAGAAYYEFDLESRSARLSNHIGDFLGRPQTGPGGFYGPPIYASAEELFVGEEQGDDDDIGLNVGLLWRAVEAGEREGKFTPGLSIGAVYRQGPQFDVSARQVVGEMAAALSGAPVGTVVFPDTGGFAEASFNVPDVYGLGVAVQATRRFRISADWDRVEYSVLTEDLITTFSSDPSAEEIAALEALTTEDGDEFHLGFEYLWRVCPAGRAADGECGGREVPIAFRAGSWLDPDHRIAFSGPVQPDSFSRANATQFADIGDDEFHYSAGIGFVFGAFQLDAAVDLSELVDTASLSFVFSF